MLLSDNIESEMKLKNACYDGNLESMKILFDTMDQKTKEV